MKVSIVVAAWAAAAGPDYFESWYNDSPAVATVEFWKVP